MPDVQCGAGRIVANAQVLAVLNALSDISTRCLSAHGARHARRARGGCYIVRGVARCSWVTVSVVVACSRRGRRLPGCQFFTVPKTDIVLSLWSALGLTLALP